MDLVLIDEALTPDSSRYWESATYQIGTSPDSYEKQFVRDWLLRSGWDKESEPPRLPDDIVAQTRERYSPPTIDSLASHSSHPQARTSEEVLAKVIVTPKPSSTIHRGLTVSRDDHARFREVDDVRIGK